MRGNPLLRALAAFLCIAAAGFPLWRLTHLTAGGAQPVRAVDDAPQREVVIALSFTSAPASFRVRHLGREIWAEAAPGLEIGKTLAIPYPKDGVDLHFEVKFPDAAPLAALRVRLTDPAGEVHERSAWGRGEIDEVLTFP